MDNNETLGSSSTDRRARRLRAGAVALALMAAFAGPGIVSASHAGADVDAPKALATPAAVPVQDDSSDDCDDDDCEESSPAVTSAGSVQPGASDSPVKASPTFTG